MRRGTGIGMRPKILRVALNGHSQQYKLELIQRLERALLITAEHVRNDACLEISQLPLLPGEKKDLQQSTITTRGERRLTCRVGTGMKLGRNVEFGFENFPEKPWLGPSFARNRFQNSKRLRGVMKTSGLDEM